MISTSASRRTPSPCWRCSWHERGCHEHGAVGMNPNQAGRAARLPGRAAALGAGLVTAGCSGTYDFASGFTGTSGGATRSTLVYWNLLSGGDGAHMEAMEAAYTKAHPEVDPGVHDPDLGKPVLHQVGHRHRVRQPARRGHHAPEPDQRVRAAGHARPDRPPAARRHAMRPSGFTPLAWRGPTSTASSWPSRWIRTRSCSTTTRRSARRPACSTGRPSSRRSRAPRPCSPCCAG